MTQATSRSAVVLCAAVLLLAATLGSATSDNESTTCRPAVCTNRTLAAALNLTNATAAYDRCVADAGAEDAFVCRCTKVMYDCMAHPHFGKCSQPEAVGPCWRYVTAQNKGCSHDLCAASTIAATLAVALATTLALLS
jgi:hypothetical protein